MRKNVKGGAGIGGRYEVAGIRYPVVSVADKNHLVNDFWRSD